MTWSTDASAPVRRNWVVDVGDDRPRLMRWRDGSGPIDLTAVDLVLKIVWTDGSLELRAGTDPGLYKLDQALWPGWFGFRLSQEQGLLLPIDYPSRYDLRALRLGLRCPLSRGSLTVLRGDNLDV